MATVPVTVVVPENAWRRLGIVDNRGNIGIKEKPWFVP